MDKINLLLNNIKALLASDNGCNITFIAITSIIIFIWIGLAAYSASYVELRGGRNGLTFTLGILFPVIVPLLAILLKSGRETKELFVAGELVHSYDYQKDHDQADAHDDGSNQDQVADEETFNMQFFKLKLKTLGANQTYQLSMDGRLVTVNRILECLPNVLLAEMIDEDNKSQRMRIPYVKIQGVRY